MKAAFFIFVICLSPVFRAQAQPETDPSTDTIISTQRGKLDQVQNKENIHLLYHRPLYFAYGEPQTKIQLSFKSALVDEVPLYFGYTQIMFWALAEQSKPFTDSTYNPELFYRQRVVNSVVKSVDFGIFEHRSNGKAEAASRSYNQSYIKLNADYESKYWVTAVSTKFSYLYETDDTNRDIMAYVSPLEIEVRFIQLLNWWVNENEFDVRFHPGGKYAQEWDKGGYEVGWNFRLGKLKVVPSFYIQYYSGYAESLLNYNEYVHEWRAGFRF